ncbi:surface-adhesin E family protein [Phenylobacterium sp.]|uniref:surface-adhesin E family protein n=1 Tax=Phenylobacterium sp. TaxID=1871053 RepID=UPI0027359A92|nr:surface-adhesin E family protein [Phenylobacterium sp.]MDP3853506.1 hypothetical protein [Phenylobacterium sp.]
MGKAVIAGLALALLCATAAKAAPFATVAFKKGESALVYDTGSVVREESNAFAWTYVILHKPLEGATLIATYREFSCALGRTRDLSRRFATASGETVRAVEQPDAWQDVDLATDRGELLRQVCQGKPLRVVGAGLSVFALQSVVRDALATGATKSASR